MIKPVFSPSSNAPVLRAFGEEVIILLNGEQTGGALTVFVETTPPGCGPPPHFHEQQDELFHVLEGCVSFFIDGRWIEAHTGDTVFAPRQQVHAFKNNTTQPTRMLIETMPSGFENFFAEVAVEFAKPEGPSMQRAVQIAESHGIRFVKEEGEKV